MEGLNERKYDCYAGYQVKPECNKDAENSLIPHAFARPLKVSF